MSKFEFDQEWAEVLEAQYEEYLWDCEASIDGEESEDFETLSGEAFDGCSTCYTREQLFFLIPRIIKAYKEGKITFDEE